MVCAPGLCPGLPAGITKRVDSSCRAWTTDRAGRLYLCRRSPRPVPTASSTSSTQWSRPIRIDVCSMFARMPRYAPAASGTRSALRIPASGQNGSSRHMLALFDGSSRIINEQRSELLIRGFGVQVPGGAPVLTWGFIDRRSSLRARFVLIFFLRSWLTCWSSSGTRGGVQVGDGNVQRKEFPVRVALSLSAPTRSAHPRAAGVGLAAACGPQRPRRRTVAGRRRGKGSA